MVDENKTKISLTQEELERFMVIEEVRNGRITQKNASAILNISERHIRRLLVSVKTDGMSALANKARGQPSNRQLPNKLKEQVIRLSQTKYPDAGPTLLADLLKEKESINPCGNSQNF
jgi:transposase